MPKGSLLLISQATPGCSTSGRLAAFPLFTFLTRIGAQITNGTYYTRHGLSAGAELTFFVRTGTPVGESWYYRTAASN